MIYVRPKGEKYFHDCFIKQTSCGGAQETGLTAASPYAGISESNPSLTLEVPFMRKGRG